MNRIILIGNGFDLAHGLRTSYKHFIDNFWNKMVIEFKDLNASPKYVRFINDEYIYHGNIFRIKINNFKHALNIIDNLCNNVMNKSGYSWFKALQELFRSLSGVENGFIRMSIEHRNNFLGIISENGVLKNWNGIEDEYYKELKKCLKNDKTGEKIEKLNSDFSFIKTELKKYLTALSKDIKEIDTITSHIRSKVSHKEIRIKPFSDDQQVDRTLFLNVNYTDTEQLYAKDANDVVIHLHGELNNHENPIIFGYGVDDKSDDYERIKNMNDGRYFENIKSVRYSVTSNYNELDDFITSGEYQIFIMGHSCGGSDEYLLKRLFQNEKCLSIKIFFHKEGPNNYLDLRKNIERYLGDRDINKILVTKTNSAPLS